MKKSIGSYVVQFGMVAIPANLHPVASDNSSKTSTNLLHAGCGSRLRQQYVCESEGCVVEKENQVKGYQFAKGQYVVLTPADLEAIPLPSKGSISIDAFVEASSLDAARFEKAYVLAPGKGGARPFALLARAIAETGLVAIATICIRTKESLCALRFADRKLYLHPLLYGEEMELEGAEVPGFDQVSEKELALAEALVEHLRKPFDDSQYTDGYTAAFLQLVEQKRSGAPIIAPAPAAAKEIDFMTALQASLDAAKTKKAEGARPAAGAKAKGGKKGRAA